MKFGIREICNVTFRALKPMAIGDKKFYKHEPVFYFDTLKTSGMEGTSSTVYAQGGRGNARLVAWEGERTVTFTMEDALISPESLSLLTGSSLENDDDYIHRRLEIEKKVPFITNASRDYAFFSLTKEELAGKNPVVKDSDFIAAYVFVEGEGEPYIIQEKDIVEVESKFSNSMFEPNVSNGSKTLFEEQASDYEKISMIYNTNANKKITSDGARFELGNSTPAVYVSDSLGAGQACKEFLGDYFCVLGHSLPAKFRTEAQIASGYIKITHIDYYYKKKIKTLLIEPDIKGQNFYLEGETLFRDGDTGYDYPAIFILPNCRIQSNFNINMASSGDPSSFTFTIDAFPGYLKHGNNKNKKVLAAIQIDEETVDEAEDTRTQTYAADWD